MNARALVRTSQAVAKNMIDAGIKGSIVNISSTISTVSDCRRKHVFRETNAARTRFSESHPRAHDVLRVKGSREPDHQMHGHRAGKVRHPHQQREPHRGADAHGQDSVVRPQEIRTHHAAHTAGQIRRSVLTPDTWGPRGPGYYFTNIFLLKFDLERPSSRPIWTRNRTVNRKNFFFSFRFNITKEIGSLRWDCLMRKELRTNAV